MHSAVIFDIERGSFVDGPGIRTTVFFKGCNLACKWCHNPESQTQAPTLLVSPDRCTACGTCRKICPHGLTSCSRCGECTIFCPSDARKLCGVPYTVSQLIAEIEKDRHYFAASGGGVTFSGGECMLFPDFLAELLQQCHALGIHTAVDTAGHVPFSSFQAVMPYVDLFLYDVKAFSDDLHRQGTGVGNQLILENLVRLSQEFSGNILVRIPVIPGFNAKPEEMQKISDFLRPLSLSGIELLPYHRLGEHKYTSLGKEIPAYPVPTSAELDALRTLFA